MLVRITNIKPVEYNGIIFDSYRGFICDENREPKVWLDIKFNRETMKPKYKGIIVVPDMDPQFKPDDKEKRFPYIRVASWTTEKKEAEA